MKKWNKVQKWLWLLPKTVVYVTADVYPKSPFYDAHSELKVTLFNREKWTYKLDVFKTPMTPVVGKLDTHFIRVAYPRVQSVKVHYPDDWAKMIQEARAKGWNTDDRW